MQNRLPETISHKVSFSDSMLFRSLVGEHNKNLKVIESAVGTKINVRGSDIEISGDHAGVELGKKLINELYALIS
ncbi:MAG: KH domain-containing protein, partial [Pseudomonadota bacterium]